MYTLCRKDVYISRRCLRGIWLFLLNRLLLLHEIPGYAYHRFTIFDYTHSHMQEQVRLQVSDAVSLRRPQYRDQETHQGFVDNNLGW